MSNMFSEFSQSINNQLVLYQCYGLLPDSQVSFWGFGSEGSSTRSLEITTNLVNLELRDTNVLNSNHLILKMGGGDCKMAAYWLAALHCATELALGGVGVWEWCKILKWQEPPIAIKFRASLDIASGRQPIYEFWIKQRPCHELNGFVAKRSEPFVMPPEIMADLKHSYFRTELVQETANTIAVRLKRLPMVALFNYAREVRAKRMAWVFREAK